MAPQSKFTVTLPTQDDATPPNALTVGQITALDFVVGANAFTWPVPATEAVGATVTALFSALTPPFVPVAGTTYSADVLAVDASGNGLPSTTITWTQNAAVPAAPTGFTVA
jgi:hypothetical protein